MNEEEFYEKVGSFLASLRPDLDGLVDPETELWETGYLDSFALMETITYLEELFGHPFEIGADDLAGFSSMKEMYRSFGTS